MHPRNPYKEPPDFLELAQAYPELKPFVYISKKGNPSINFKDADGLRLLTLSLLHRDFGLDLELPTDRLCPAIPNRLNYILWIQDILANSSRPDETVRGIDIGTGASVIYPLLACKLSPSWVFVATDIDTRSLMVAESNVARNGLQNRIIVKQSLPDGPIISDVLLDPSFPAYDFVMCNPPFYGSREEVDQATEDKEFDPSAACTGADFEMITPGGEGVFVTRIVNESVDVGKRCRWFTSLLGKHTSVAAVVAAIKGLKIDNYGITEFIQGNTRRWGVVWSFSDERLPDNLIRPSSDSLHSLQPPSNQLRQPILSTVDPVSVVKLLQVICMEIDAIGCIPTDRPNELRVWARDNTWSRKARRLLERMKREGSLSHSAVPSEGDARVVISISLVEFGQARAVEAKWVRGLDRELYETLWNHISRRLLERL